MKTIKGLGISIYSYEDLLDALRIGCEELM